MTYSKRKRNEGVVASKWEDRVAVTRSVVQLKKELYLCHVRVHLHFHPLCSLHLDVIFPLLLVLSHHTCVCTDRIILWMKPRLR